MTGPVLWHAGEGGGGCPPAAEGNWYVARCDPGANAHDDQCVRPLGDPPWVNLQSRADYLRIRHEDFASASVVPLIAHDVRAQATECGGQLT